MMLEIIGIKLCMYIYIIQYIQIICINIHRIIRYY